jgi:hypothetical protein
MFRPVIYDFLDKVAVGITGPMYQRWGRYLLRKGLKIQGSPYYDDRGRFNDYAVVASLRGIEINGKRPKFDRIKLIAPNAAIFGDVKFEAGVCELFNPVFCLVRHHYQGREEPSRHWQEIRCHGQC